MIEVITIDFWDTLFDSSNGLSRNASRQHVLLEEISKYGMKLSDNDYENALKSSWEFFNNIWVEEQRTPLTEETIEFLWNSLNLPYNQYSIDRIAKVFKDSILDYPPKLIDGIVEFLQKYSDKYQFGLISDTGFSPGSVLVELLEMNDIAKYFKSYSFSDETGVAKPNPKAYFKILNELNTNTENALHIGDNENTDIIGAKSIGMKAIRFDKFKSNNFMKTNSYNTIADYRCNSWAQISSIFDSFPEIK